MASPAGQRRPLTVLAIVSVFLLPPVVTAIGVNYGTKGDNLPPPATVASFLANHTSIDRVKLFDTNPDIIKAFAGTGIALMVTAGNSDIPALATKAGAAAWVAANIAPYYPATDISLVAVGNEIMATADRSLIGNLVPAMRTLKAALVAASYPKIRVSTPHSLGILSISEPPSASRFRVGYDRVIFAPMLEFHRQTKSPFIVNPYPYFGYNGATLDYALARPNPGVRDAGTGITYTSMFEAQLDSVYSAMKSLGYEDVEIAVGETGWPSKAEDGQIGVSPAEAAEYNRYLIHEATSGSGTPLVPKRLFETYIFSLFNENLKPGPVAERNFGLFLPDLTPAYDVGLFKGAVAQPANKTGQTVPAPAGTPPKTGSSGATPPLSPEAKSGNSSSNAIVPAPASGDDSRNATSPEPAQPASNATTPAPSMDSSAKHEKPGPAEEEGGAEAPTAEPGGKEDEGSTSSGKAGNVKEGTAALAPTLAPAGSVSEATNLRLSVYSIIAICLAFA